MEVCRVLGCSASLVIPFEDVTVDQTYIMLQSSGPRIKLSEILFPSHPCRCDTLVTSMGLPFCHFHEDIAWTRMVLA